MAKFHAFVNMQGTGAPNPFGELFQVPQFSTFLVDSVDLSYASTSTSGSTAGFLVNVQYGPTLGAENSFPYMMNMAVGPGDRSVNKFGAFKAFPIQSLYYIWLYSTGFPTATDNFVAVITGVLA